MNELRDIRGIDPISWWPPAPGWWLLVIVLLLLLPWVWRRWRMRGDWRTHAKAKLRQLNRRLNKDDCCDAEGCEVMVELSMILRRAAIARFGRRQAAGLSGMQWLDFLAQHDASGFDWSTEARLMVELPYAPPGLEVEHDKVRALIRAARAWVKHSGRPD